jgi:hypothetical protein
MLTHHAAVAQYGDPVADFKHLFQEVRNVNDTNTCPGEISDNPKKTIAFPGGKARGWLVHHEDFGMARYGFYDLRQLLGSNTQLGDRRRHRQIDAKGRRFAAGGPAQLPVVDRTGKAPGRFASERDVLSDRKMWDKSEILIDYRHAICDGDPRIMQCHLSAIDMDRPSVVPIDTPQDLHQGAFASAVSQLRSIPSAPGDKR